MKRFAILFGVLLLITALSGYIVTGDPHCTAILIPGQRTTQSVLDSTSRKIADVLNGLSRNLRSIPSDAAVSDQTVLQKPKSRPKELRICIARSISASMHVLACPSVCFPQD